MASLIDCGETSATTAKESPELPPMIRPSDAEQALNRRLVQRRHPGRGTPDSANWRRAAPGVRIHGHGGRRNES